MAGCGGAIRKGEEAVYTREAGLVHPECRGQSTARLNAKPDRCAACGKTLAVGEGRLHHREVPVEGSGYRHSYSVSCATCPSPYG